MYKATCRLIIIWLVVIAGICHAERPPREAREQIVVKILSPAGEGASSESVKSLTNSLVSALRAEQFEVQVLSDGQRNPREHLEQNPSTYHIIADLLTDESSGVQATVYTQGIASPRRFKAEGVPKLAGQVLEYLESEEMVRLRVEMGGLFRDLSATEPDKKFAAYIRLGINHLLVKNNLDEAIRAFEEAEKIKKDSAVPHFNLALCYRRKGDVEKSRQQVQTGLQLDPENHDLRNQKAVLLMADGNFREAIVILEDLRDDDPIVQWNLAYSYSQNGELDKAERHLGKIIELHADGSMRMIAKDQLQELQKKKDELQKELQKKENSLKITMRGLWIALVGLVCVGIIALIVVFVRRASRQVTTTGKLKPADALTLKVQITIALVSGLFSILTLVLTYIFSR